MYYRPFPHDDPYTLPGEYRGFSLDYTPNESEEQHLRRLRNSAAIVVAVGRMVALGRRLESQPGRGLLPALARRFYPETAIDSLSTSPNRCSSSSASVGSTVDRELSQFAESLSLPEHAHHYTRLVAEFCRRHRFYPLAAQLRVPVAGFVTAADLVYLNNNTGRMGVLEIKTGYDHDYDSPCRRQPTLHFLGAPNTWRSHHLLQMSITLHAFTKPPYNLPAEALEGYVLRVNETDGVCPPDRVPTWFDPERVWPLLETPLARLRARLRRERSSNKTEEKT